MSGAAALDPATTQVVQALVDDLAHEMTSTTLRTGEKLFERGDPGDALYLISAGRLAVLGSDEPDASPNDPGSVVMGRGALVGEMALIADVPRTATVVAVRDTSLRRLDRETFLSLLHERPELALRLGSVVVNRLISTPVPRPAPPATIAVVASTANGERSASREMVGEVTEALLAAVGRSRRVGAEEFDGSAPGEIVERLDRLETDHDLLVYDTVGSPEWRDRCFRQADTVLLVVDSRSRPIARLAEGAAARWARLELVVVNPTGTTVPVDASPWLDAFVPALHHHVVEHDPTTLARMARLVGGGAIGVVFSGGGARGLAHVGAWRALVESGVAVDAVAGVSIGALVGGAVALDVAPEELSRRMREGLVDVRLPFDPTVPATALLRGAEIAKRLEKAGDGRVFENTWRPFTCYSADLASGEMHTHDRGPLWLGVRASFSLPILLPPCRRGDAVLVDGAVFDNMPVQPTRERHPGLTVIGLDVGRQGTIGGTDLSESGDMSGWRVLYDRVHPGRKVREVPSLAQVLLRLVDLAGGAPSPPDLWIRPDVADFPLLNFKAADDLERIGYEATLEALDDWPPTS